MSRHFVLDNRSKLLFKNEENNTMNDERFINRLMVGALTSRLIVLLFVYLLQTFLGTSYMLSDIIHDDAKYLEGARLYSESADGIIDVEAFYSSMISIGHNARYSNENFWFWLVAIGFYIFKSEIIIRILNIILSTYTVKLIYQFTVLYQNRKTAKLAAKLYAYLPYPVIFCTFIFKDQLMAFCTMYFLLQLIKYKIDIKISKYKLLSSVLMLYIISQTRNGYISVLIIFMVIVVIAKNIQRVKKLLTFRSMIVVLFALIFFVLFSNQLYESVLSKVVIYLSKRSEYNQGIIALISINSVLDFYKFPLAFPFAILQPLPSSLKIVSWKDITALMNLTMVPLAVGNFLNLFFLKKREKLIFYGTIGIYGGTLMMSLGIFRHYYSLLPLPIIYYSTYYFSTRSRNYLYIGTGLLSFIWVIYTILF